MLGIVELPVLWVYRSSHISPSTCSKLARLKSDALTSPLDFLPPGRVARVISLGLLLGIDKFLHFMAKVLADDRTKTDTVALSDEYTRLEAGEEGKAKSKDERYAAGSASNASSPVQSGHHSHGVAGQNP